MDPRDAEARGRGNVAIGRERRRRRELAALLALHTVLTGACVVLCFYTRLQDQDASQDKGIYLNMKQDPNYNYSRLNFTVSWNQSVELKNENEVMVKHPGPYVFYIYAVVKGLSGGTGNLTLNQRGTKTSIRLVPTLQKCVRQERLVSLFENDVVTFSFERAPADLTLKDLRVGLHYILRDVYFKTPEELLEHTMEIVK